jgi:hypothetical protein
LEIDVELRTLGKVELQLSVNAKGVVELTENFLPFSQIHVALTLFDQLLILISDINEQACLSSESAADLGRQMRILLQLLIEQRFEFVFGCANDFIENIVLV